MFDQPMVDPKPSLRLRGSRANEDGMGGDGAVEPLHQHNQQYPYRNRRLEDANVDYWRKRAGWADDDESMKSYNQGVYNTYYMGDDGDGGGSVGDSGGSGSTAGKKALDHMGWILGLASTIIFLIMLVKCCSSAPSQSNRKGRTSSVKSKDSSRSIRDKHGERRSRSRSRAASGRSRSKSRTRSKSRSRKSEGGGKGGGSGGDYKLMDDEEDNKSRRSTKSSNSKRSSRSRSRSKSTRSRSRSKARSKSRSRPSGEGKSVKKESSKEQKMLV